jgi:hypothetical protein
MENFWAMINVEKIEIGGMNPHDAISAIEERRRLIV